MKFFPLFADLHGRRVLVVGGGAVAERKVRLLLEAGAQVRLVAPTLTEWLAGNPALEVRREEFDASHFAGAVLAIAATDDRAVNEAVSRAGRDRNVLVNVVDVAELSSFIVPAIVDRSPLVIAISTGGVAPVLARLVRERLEALLDGSFGQLAGLLQRWRGNIKASLPDVNARRRFYETVVRGQVAALVRNRDESGAEQELARTLEHADAPRRGSVVLVGAGPGDAGLLTLNALRALQEADVILYDRLVSDEVLNLARRDADRICVGKIAGGHSVSQGRINELLREQALQGRRVVRLKGGDPFIFGRGGEELEALERHGIPFEVVPGITAAIACGAYAGIPLTHRDHAQSVRFVTAHSGDSIDGLDWSTLARERQTLALYMGVAALGTIRDQLTRHGRAASTPVAIVEHGSRANQRVVLASLAELEEAGRAAAVQSPALVIVGEVAALATRLHWFGAAPVQWRELRAAAA